ncbi:uncharacterized protein LOC129724015 [Wyeomyia smithii]|uniref:uncharacterized protein LOC129724015 n=1 Tax=Wyeomyia smithii TaxID=174621 RepID=UPI0024681287|nr:uncharacterized protein LOC129724015 [Wyeomyia smithii]
MATNTGMKIFRDFFRDSPCRKAYMLTHQTNFGHQYVKNNSLRKPNRQLDLRPKTAPILPSSLAQAVANHNLLDNQYPERMRPTTSGKVLKRRDNTPLSIRRPGSGNKPLIPSRPRKSIVDIGSRSPPTSSDNGRRKQKHPKQFKSKVQNQKSTIKPCKICIDEDDCVIENQSQNLEKKRDHASDGFEHLVQEIDNIRFQLANREDMRQISHEESLRLINEIKRMFHAQMEPFNATLQPEKKKLKIKEMVRSPRFSGGRISTEYFDLSKIPGRVEKDFRKAKTMTKHTNKSFEQGPLRLLLPYMKDAISEKQVRF